ncbi:unknown similar to AMEV044 [Adoxophyes honmai entomopoxvirus 'L']|uniref:Uncharacterized protein n=1 Tax=Adoxophyes honmai entomopoxvirus 'L' TaxID=1293540 RepID=A0A916P634_9POXV|nr:unknown similar to AMEV044 [Adoxophyes honmai entomopoxvirus 'L']CCU55365.1 unknown similar to AMEV044 [Adoxophyes honmai entomopoxvirus 'L']
MSYTLNLQSNKDIKKNLINILLIDVSKIKNVNVIPKNMKIHNFFSDQKIKYTDIFAHKFFNEYINRKPEVNSLNMNMLFNIVKDNIDILKYRGGYVTLMSMEVNEINYNNTMLSNTISLQSIFLFYKFIYSSTIENVIQYNRNISYEDKGILKFDDILINILNTPNSQFELMNNIFLYRTFPIFNYIMYKNKKKYCDKIKSANFDFLFDNPNIMNTTCLNYMLTESTEIENYINNIKNVLNNNINILDYNLYTTDDIIITGENISYIYNNIQESINNSNNYYLFDREIVENNDDLSGEELLNNLHSIVVEEIRLDYIKNYTDMYFNINKIIKLPNVVYPRGDLEYPNDISNIGIDVKILSHIRTNNIKISKDDVHRLLVRGLLRFYIESFTSLLLSIVKNANMAILPNSEFVNDIEASLQNISNISTINDFKMETINLYYKYILTHKQYDYLYSNMIFNNSLLNALYNNNNTNNRNIVNTQESIPNDFDILLEYNENETDYPVLRSSMSVCKYKKLYKFLWQNKFNTQIVIIEKFINTLSFINTIKNSKNYALYIFYLFSNINIKVLLDPDFNNNALCVSLNNLYNTKYSAYVKYI